MGETIEFKVGDRVIGIGICDGVDLTGRLGTIRRLGWRADVEFDEPGPFHNLGGQCKDKHGWHCDLNTIELYNPPDEWVDSFEPFLVDAML